MRFVIGNVVVVVVNITSCLSNIRELLDAVVAQVGDVHETRAVGGHTAWSFQLVTGTVNVELPSAGGVEHLHNAPALLRTRRQVTPGRVDAHAAVGSALMRRRRSGTDAGADLVQVAAIAGERLSTKERTKCFN